MSEKTVSIPNIDCHHCVAAIQREISEIKGVQAVVGDPKTKQVTIKWDVPADWDAISRTLAEIGYPAEK